jgi:hypothetical protein
MNLADSEAVTWAMSFSTVAFDASAIGDPDGTRTVIAIVALLIVMGLALVMVAFWMRRVTRPDPEFLAPLELMGERSWRNGDPVWQRRMLDEVRPDRAVPLKRAAKPPRFDESFDDVPTATGFDDLRSDARAPAASTSSDDESVVAVGPTTPTQVSVVRSESLDRADDDAHDRDDDDAAPTPTASNRPLDDFPDHDIDAAELERARAELDEELRHRGTGE